MSNKTKSDTSTRRDFLRKAGYMAPAVLSLPAVPSFANSGSNRGNTTVIVPNSDGLCYDSNPITTGTGFRRSRGACNDR